MPYFRTEDHCAIYYETRNWESSSPVVVFLNGTLQTTLHWRPNVVSLQDRFRLLLYDARGQGRSELGPRNLSLETHLDDFSALLKYLGIDRMYLLGLSHGAVLALVYAAVSPMHAERLVLCSVSATPSCRVRLIVRSWLEILKRSGLEAMVWASLPLVFGETYLKQNERILPMIVKSLVRRNRKESVMAQLAAMDTYAPLAESAKRIRVPCLVISASDDPLVTEEGARALSRLCGGRHEHVRGAGHTITAEKTEWFNDTVLDFFSATR